MSKIPVRKQVGKYTLKTLGSQGRGKKIIVYGASGMGKTTLCSLLPNPAFLSLDGGADEIRHPETGEQLQGINLTTFVEVQEALQSDMFDSVDTIVVDHVTELQQLAQPFMFKTIKKEHGETAKSIEDYGFHKGYRHWYDTMRLILQDCDRWIRKGKNVSILNSYVSWADHVFRIEYSQLVVNKKGKANPVKTRQIRVHPDATFYAKSRTIPAEYDTVTFSKPEDDSIWRLLFDD